MKPTRLALLAAATASVAAAQSAAPAPAPAAAPAAPATISEALSTGKVSLNVRLRYETVDQDNATDDADALTVRTRLGYKTAAYMGFTGMIEAQNTTAIIDDYAFPGGGDAGHDVVADPDITDISQAWLSYKYESTTATVGRQNLVLDNARFVGNVAWRQNYQTFDSVVVKDTTFDKVSLTYGYLWGINRIFGDLAAAQPDYDSDSHIFNASYSGLPFGTVTGYAYLLDFDNAAANSTATYGASFVGGTPLSDTLKLTYRAEYATQSDYGSSTLGYDADYYVGELGLVVAKKYGAAVGYEVLGSDNGVGFKTPLATLHAFNGWADKFLTTPAAGLTDTYVKLSAELPASFSLLAFYHEFESDAGSLDYGDEIDLQLTYKVNKNLSFLAKAAFFEAGQTAAIPGAAGANQDTDKFSIQADYSF